MRQRGARAQGFSLLELMVVVTLIAILVLLAAPSMAEWTRNQRIRGATENLLNGLQMARDEAIRRNRPVSFWLVSDLSSSCTLSNASSIWIISINSPWHACNSAPSVTTDPLLVKASEAPGALYVQAFDQGGGAASQVRFDGYGRTPDGVSRIAQIEIRDPLDADKTDAATHAYRSMRLVIQGSGAVRMCDPRVTTAGDTRAC